MTSYAWKAGALEGTADTLTEADRQVRAALGSKGKLAVAVLRFYPTGRGVTYLTAFGRGTPIAYVDFPATPAKAGR